MIEQLSKILFSLMRCELKKEAIDENIKLLCRDESVLSKIYLISKKHDVAHLIYSALVKNNIISPDDESDHFQREMMMAVYRYEQTKYSLEHIQQLLDQADIPYVPLKGAVINTLYSPPWLRTSCDIDILIHPKDTTKAIDLLIQNGYLRKNDTSSHDHSFITPNKMNLELHYSLDQGPHLPKANTVLERVWEYCTPCENDRFSYQMAQDMLVFYHIAHMANHFLHGGCGIRPFIDLWLLNKNGYCISPNLYNLLNEADLTSFYEESMNLIKVWFEHREHSTLTKHMEAFVLTGGVYGAISHSAAVKAAKGESKFKSFSKLVFLSRSNLEIIYPNLRKHPVLLPYYQTKRWFRFINPQKRKQILTLTAERNSVSKEAVCRVEFLLEGLKLK